MRVTRTVGVEVPDLSQKIKAAIDADDRSISAIAAAAKLDRSYVHKIINGTAPSTAEDTLQQLEAALGVSFGVTRKLDDAALAAAGIG